MPHYDAVLIALLCLLLPASYFDIREFRIPNGLTLGGVVGGLAFAFALGGLVQLGNAFVALLAAFFLSLPFWLLGWVGAGDVKLLAGVGTILGFPHILVALACVAFAGLVLALVAMAWHGLLLHTLHRFASTIGMTLVTKKATYVPPDEAESKVKLPYAVAITLGSLIAALISG